MRCAIYCRISLDATGEQLGVTRQLEDCKNLAASLDWTIVETYVDNDISASSGRLRPQYRAMLAAIKAGEVQAVVAWHPDRLYRKLRDLEELIEVSERNGVTIRTVRAGEFDLATPTGKMLARILASVSAGEGDIKADRWKRSIRQRRERGDLPKMGPRLYGYERDGTINLNEAKQIVQLVDDLLDGIPIIRATHRLNERGSRTTLGNEWSRPSVAKFLRNGRLAGRSTLNGDTLARGDWEPIVTDETFEELQTILDARRGTVPQRPRVALLLNLIHCSRCGKKMVTGGRAARNGGGKVRSYRCSTMPAHGGCGGVSIAAEPVEQMVEAVARTLISDPRVRARLDELGASASANAAEIVQLEERLTELEAQLDEPGIPVGAITRAMDRTLVRIDDLRTDTDASAVGRLSGAWPDELGPRVKLVRAVIARVDIGSANGRSGIFDPSRVTITPVHAAQASDRADATSDAKPPPPGA